MCQYQLIILLSCVSHWSPIFILSLCIRIAKSLVSLGKKIIWMCIYWANEREKMSLKRKFIFNKRTPHPHHNILIINYRMLVYWSLFGPWIVDLCSMPPLHFFCLSVHFVSIQILPYASGHYTLLIKTCAFYVHNFVQHHFYLPDITQNIFCCCIICSLRIHKARK